MTTTRTKCNADKVTEAPAPAELDVQELDPPDPAIARWQELADRDVDIYHDGDASKVIAEPRPAWSDPAEDLIGSAVSSFAYASSPVRIVNKLGYGVGDEESLKPARVYIRAVFAPQNALRQGVQIGLSRATGKTKDKPWINSEMILTTDEVSDLVDALTAALDLFGGVK